MSMFYNGSPGRGFYDHVVVDIETLGTIPGAPIVQIAAVAFALGASEDEWELFEVKVDVRSLIYKDGISFDTLAWWVAQPKGTIDEVFGEAERLDIASALNSFHKWLGFTNTKTLWGNGAAFDNELLKAALLQYCCIREPWNFRIDRCFRTVKNLYKEQVPEPHFIGTKHNALDDAMHQARWLTKILTHKQEADSALSNLVAERAAKVTP